MIDLSRPDNDAMVKAVINDPMDRVSAFALADRLEEEGESLTLLARAVRWMGWYDLRPGWRDGERIKKPWVWYMDRAYLAHDPTEGQRRDANPHAELPLLVFIALKGGHGRAYVIYRDWAAAVAALADCLEKMRQLLEEPKS
jgi:hypothetical protein